MSAALVELGGVDPLQAGDGEVLCSARSDVAVGMVDAFRCTRADDHVRQGDAEHVAAAPYESRLPVAVGAWLDGGAPRVMGAAR